MIICAVSNFEEFRLLHNVIDTGCRNLRGNPIAKELDGTSFEVTYIKTEAYENMLRVYPEVLNMISSKDEYEDVNLWANDLKKMLDENILSHMENLKTPEDWKHISDTYARFLGFKKWDETNLWLIPKYLYSVIPVGLKVKSVNGDIIVNDGTNLSSDTRCGLLAYGIHVKE